MSPTTIDMYLAQETSPWRRGVARATSYCRTIRGRIFVAFIVMTMITAALAGYAILGINDAGPPGGLFCGIRRNTGRQV